MAGHALYGMAPCFGHTGVTFDAENDRPGPGTPAASEVILRPPESNGKIVTQHGYTCTTLLLSRRNICMCQGCAFVWLPE